MSLFSENTQNQHCSENKMFYVSTPRSFVQSERKIKDIGVRAIKTDTVLLSREGHNFSSLNVKFHAVLTTPLTYRINTCF